MNLEQDMGSRVAVWKVITSKAIEGIFATQKLLLMISRAPQGSSYGLLVASALLCFLLQNNNLSYNDEPTCL